MHAGKGPIAGVVGVADIASMVPPATAPERRRLAGYADGLHEAGRYGCVLGDSRILGSLLQVLYAPCTTNHARERHSPLYPGTSLRVSSPPASMPSAAERKSSSETLRCAANGFGARNAAVRR